VAISATHYALLKELRTRNELPQGGRILEIGAANWYGDCDPREFAGDETDSFAIVRKLYESLMSPEVVAAIDMDHTAKDALPHDLNERFRPASECRFDLAINHGTAEHIFNIANVFRIMHDATKVGGLMIHESPFTGWVDHGFYCLQPTLFWDVAHANSYKIVLMACEHLSSKSYFLVRDRDELLEHKRLDRLADNLMLFVAMRKAVDAPFKVPMQGVYAGNVSAGVQSAWRELR
jgi:hypothetical protein